MQSSDLGDALLRLARGAIAARLGLEHSVQGQSPNALAEPGATFVTLTQSGRLRGCIGSLQAHRPLAEDVRENAMAAAFRDARFSPLRREEFAQTQVEVSLLSAPQPMQFDDEAHALAQIRPGVDGVILAHADRRATFLPQVWDSLPDPRRFLAELKHKAGLPADFWSEQLILARYQVTKWREVEEW